ncbi:ABC transporter [Methylovirgula ligni]|uniref:ATP-binding cassette subfamily B protein n=1 Tax=Methylovirgula ligni TaxID=569860 RepID=A0A3D9Z2E8_9HYPH|nr:ABC transporter transmembrane domain-containing protein [Methylovirgula ligni]QAY94634.1 ABC transporter [Methylovirgula ligni]REF87489.1 ATP-binding cassette subfamily B protein [Methylovirgula ligni]
MSSDAPLIADDADGAKQRNSPKFLLALAPYVARYKGRVAAALVALTIAAAATLVVPVAVRLMIDDGFSTQSAGTVNRYFGAMVLVVGVLALASGGRYYLVMTLGERVVADLRAAVFRHLSSLDASFFDGARVGELVSRLTADTTQLKSTFGASASIALRNFFMFIGAVGLMIYTSPKLSAFVLIAIPLIVLPLYAAGRAVRKRSRAAQDTLAEASAYASENLGAVRVMQAFGAEAATNAHFDAAVEESYDAARVATLARAVVTAIAIFLAFASVVVVLWLGAQDVLAGRISGGLLSQFVLYAVLAAGALGELSQVWSEVSAAAGAAGRIGEILAIKSRIVTPQPPVPLPTPPRGAIVFDHVNFAYPSRPDAAALHDLSFKVAPGETVAIVGPSGAGKSTIFQLLLRFYDPLGGRIEFDGVDIKTADPAELRKRISLVPQEPVIFAASFADNIRYGAPGASEAAVEDAARKAAAQGFITATAQGYAMKIGERGVTLSGGERQRLAIARAILREAPVLLLDEATSALDASSEGLVQAALKELKAGRTTLVIAHRLATVLSADRILVLDAGRIVEEGTHASLVARDGLYARLARLQFETGAHALSGSSAAAE